ncbi:MAG: hypothetical protein ALECFALPRED_008723 [Alectoria fallacina]|uniref:Uncharacterized protein n=1 Tax=Alectoria fallacina TaxID=1903189 RepID=A0A8H3IER7_9LECA|nr:MAG: hypothetical protein ALECFALPRED_008723 [Alectoria fallacina]
MAYFALGIDNGALLTDEDVGVACYKRRSLDREFSTFLRDALEFIAEARKSRFLRFLATIGEHLNEKNVAVLAKKTFAASSEHENFAEESVSAESVNEGPTGGESFQNLASESSESEMEMDTYGEYYATSEDSPSQPRSPSSSEASISSNDGMSADSDFSEEVCGVFFDQYIWRCEECSTALVDWKCPRGHELRRCKTCGWQLENGPCHGCLGMCGACGGERVDGQCRSCGAGAESEDEDTIVFDELDGLWRCIYCQWEVEADNETDGNCHCLNDKREAHFIDLSDCLDYEPADSCSSEDDSTDSESNSDDEGFIDDAEIPMDEIAPDAAIEAVNLAALYPAGEVAKIMKFVEMAKGAKTAEDKENVEPIASSDDIEILDAPTANELPKLPSNIIDCESMDI